MFQPTFVLPVAEIIVLPMCHKMVWLALFTERRLGQAIITYRGAIGVALVKIVDEFGTAGIDIRLSDIRLTLETLLKLSAQWPTSSKQCVRQLAVHPC